jgi:hypothetical protein
MKACFDVLSKCLAMPKGEDVPNISHLLPEHIYDEECKFK